MTGEGSLAFGYSSVSYQRAAAAHPGRAGRIGIRIRACGHPGRQVGSSPDPAGQGRLGGTRHPAPRSLPVPAVAAKSSAGISALAVASLTFGIATVAFPSMFLAGFPAVLFGPIGGLAGAGRLGNEAAVLPRWHTAPIAGQCRGGPNGTAANCRYLKSSLGCLRRSFTGLRAASWTRYLKYCLRRTANCVTHVTCVYLLVAAAFESWPRPEPHVSDMSLTQNPCSTRAFPKWT
jgi:hypothetical protein